MYWVDIPKTDHSDQSSVRFLLDMMEVVGADKAGGTGCMKHASEIVAFSEAGIVLHR